MTDKYFEYKIGGAVNMTNDCLRAIVDDIGVAGDDLLLSMPPGFDQFSDPMPYYMSLQEWIRLNTKVNIAVLNERSKAVGKLSELNGHFNRGELPSKLRLVTEIINGRTAALMKILAYREQMTLLTSYCDSFGVHEETIIRSASSQIATIIWPNAADLLKSQ